MTESTLIDDASAPKRFCVSCEPSASTSPSMTSAPATHPLRTYARFPINVVKIDKSFVRTIGTEREDTAIVSAVLALAKNLDIDVVAEGVETPEQLAVLLHLQCPYFQGYLFSHPRPVNDLHELIEAAPFNIAGAGVTNS